MAAGNGHLHSLQWARANGCPWNVQACAGFARTNGHDAVNDWIDAVNIGDTDDDEQNDDDDDDETNDNNT
jgi:hypothetical protein